MSRSIKLEQSVYVINYDELILVICQGSGFSANEIRQLLLDQLDEYGLSNSAVRSRLKKLEELNFLQRLKKNKVKKGAMDYQTTRAGRHLVIQLEQARNRFNQLNKDVTN